MNIHWSRRPTSKSYWTCPGCGRTIADSDVDMVVDHVHDCPRVDGAGRPVQLPEPMDHANGPGWTVEFTDDDGQAVASYFLWAPRTGKQARRRGRDYWAACWEMNGGHDGNFVKADTPERALAGFATCPRREEAEAAAMALLDAGLKHTALDTASSASRQHYIDTGRYLTYGEAMDL